MSNSIITNYAVATVDAKVDGKFVYFLFTEGYEKNVFPHDPSWCIRTIGDYDTCWKFIINSAAYCEDGCYETKSGRTISPTSYVDSWRNAFRNVGRIAETDFKIKFGSGFYEVKNDFYEHFSSVFNSNGISIAEHSCLNLNNPFVLKSIVELFAEPLKIPVTGSYWPLTYYYFEVLNDIPRNRSHDLPKIEANINHVNQNSNIFDKLDVEVFSVGNSNDDLVMLVDGNLFVFGPRYKLMFAFISEYGVEHEIDRHGSFHDFYRKLQEILKNPIEIPAGSHFTLTRPDQNASKWLHQDYIECVNFADSVIDDDHISIDARIRSDFYAFSRYPIDLMDLKINRSQMIPALTSQKQISLLV